MGQILHGTAIYALCPANGCADRLCPLGRWLSHARVQNYPGRVQWLQRSSRLWLLCAAKDEKHYGFEGHIIISFDGVICGYTFAAANIDERDVLQDMTTGLKGLLIGDKGFIRPLLKAELAQQQIDLQTPLRKNMTGPRPKPLLKQLMKVRRLVETVIGQLAERFHIERVHARDLWHLANRFIRKLLAHTMGVFLNKLFGNQPLQFEALVEI